MDFSGLPLHSIGPDLREEILIFSWLVFNILNCDFVVALLVLFNLRLIENFILDLIYMMSDFSQQVLEQLGDAMH